jgi:phytoene dehydrogenase-like protein
VSSRATTHYDAIVIGAGHNGLVCAAYLAQGGLRTLVLERRAEVGGMATTSKIMPGVRVPTLAHTVGRMWPSIARELGLRRHSLTLVRPDARVFSPQPDGQGLTLWSDPARTSAELADNQLVGRVDADAYLLADARLAALARTLAVIIRRAEIRAADLSLLRVMPMAVRDLVAEWFDSDVLRASVAARAMLLSGMGPRMPGSAGVLVGDSVGVAGPLAGQTVFARGGPGALSAALAAAARAAGAEIRTGAEVVAVRSANGRADGVALTDGSEFQGEIVVSDLDPRTTLLRLLEPEVLGPRLSWRATNIRQRGATSKVNFALRGLPLFPAARTDASRIRGRILIAPGMAALDRAARPQKYGELPGEPLLEATIPTLVDPSLIDADRSGAVRHVMSVIVQGTPYELRDGTWDARRNELGDIVTRVLETYAPGFSNLIEARQVITPLDIEREYGAEGGHPMHAEIGLDQWFAWRPLHGYGRYRMPLDGLYLCGSGANPGGGITGGPGRLAAKAILADLRGGRLRVSA